MAAWRREWADMSGGAGGFRDAGDHSIGVSAVDGIAGHRAKDESSLGAATSARFEDTQHGDGDRHGGGLVTFPDEVDHSVSSKGFGVVLDPDRSCFGGT